MKRGTISDSDSTRERNKNKNVNKNQTQPHYLGPSFSDLPKDIIINIFCRLYIETILACKSVCKTWRDLISDPKFAKHHFDEHHDQVYPLIHAADSESRFEMLYLAQPDEDDFEQKLDMCDHTYSKPGCICNVRVTLNTKFVLPPSDNDLAIDVKCPYFPAYENEYRVVNSCNGLLCLSHRTDNRGVVICNPVTGEFMNLPEGKRVNFVAEITYGFGFSNLSNQYKVVRIVSDERFTRSAIYKSGVSAKVHIVGTQSWKDTRNKLEYFIDGSPTYLNGFLYWSYGSKPLSLISFDIENESFVQELGPEMDQIYKHENIDVGVLGGEICITSITKSGSFHVWALKDSGAKKTWSRVISIDMSSYAKQIFHGWLQPLKYLSDGSLLVFHYHWNALVHLDRKRCRFRFLKIREMESKVKTVVAYTPSLVSLKDSLSGHDLKILNFQSRCKELKLDKPVKDLDIIEEEFPDQ